MKGYLQKTGKRTRMRVQRYFELDDTQLSSCRTKGSAPTWTVDVSDAILTGNEHTMELNIEIPDCKTISLYADNAHAFGMWMHALQVASSRKFEQYYKTKAVLGVGSCSVVKVVENVITGEQYAAKFIDKVRMGKRFGDHELRTARGVNHPNIVKTFDVFETKEFYIIISERMTKGQLYDVLANSSPSEQTISRYVKQILLALSHLHENGVVHRNLKPENLFVDGRGSIYTIKISDCGTRNWYRVFPEDKDPEVRAIGDGAYVAPEVLAQKDFSDRMDLYSVGVLTCHMLVGVLPMTAANAPNLAAPQLEKVSSVGVQFLSGMLKENPAERLSLSQALDHPWIKSFETLPTHPIGADLSGLASSNRREAVQLDLREKEKKGTTAFTTAGSYERRTPDVLVYGARSVADPSAYSMNRDPWGRKANPAAQSNGMFSKSQKIREDGSKSMDFSKNGQNRNSRGLFRGLK
mmetsp:Transcript_12161/g.50403  ORF Transcript_12161/g.50403 Transcript_12161/m.50403 type:complete len:466 (-) Transcript_12161:1074-2471(-)|eukprot:CAMPEP_0113961602 /NCGR_PEP_ID=MMETSP0011_2-20120614/5407_1 /TAXON_ID=101924 /ORGANISM="Rhodosorus marinus" /LENGTH=465 /DNA_ID=CAMNT_0000973275 /DNA_START=309 /DNA_END=1706 /DNA_ORIENTATION=+ /assembly_acc=CAM_ASM_000156